MIVITKRASILIKSIIVLIIAVLAVLFFLFRAENEKKSKYPKELLFLNEWNYSIVAKTNEKILIEIPFYDFQKRNLSTYNVKINSNKIKLDSYQVLKKEEKKDFTNYSMLLNVFFDQPGNLADEKLQVEFAEKDKKYEILLGNFHGVIFPEAEAIATVRTTSWLPLFITPFQNTVQTQYEANLINDSNENLVIDDILLPNGYQLSNTFSQITLKPKMEHTIRFDVKGPYNTRWMIKPALKVGAKTIPLNPKLVAWDPSLEDLLKIKNIYSQP